MAWAPSGMGDWSDLKQVPMPRHGDGRSIGGQKPCSIISDLRGFHEPKVSALLSSDGLKPSRELCPSKLPALIDATIPRSCMLTCGATTNNPVDALVHGLHPGIRTDPEVPGVVHGDCGCLLKYCHGSISLPDSVSAPEYFGRCVR
jgi:hypothetical protein